MHDLLEEIEVPASNERPSINGASALQAARGQIDSLLTVLQQFGQSPRPARPILLPHDPAGVFHDMTYFAAVAGEDRHPTGKRFELHACQLPAPPSRRLARNTNYN